MTSVTSVADFLKLCTNLPSASRVAVDLCECPCFSRLEDRHLILLTASYQRARTVNGRQVRPHLTEHLLSLFGCTICFAMAWVRGPRWDEKHCYKEASCCRKSSKGFLSLFTLIVFSFSLNLSCSNPASSALRTRLIDAEFLLLSTWYLLWRCMSSISQ